MLLDITFTIAGLALLYFGAEWLVRGGAGLALSFGVRTLVIGLTVVAYGTSAPELVVCTLAALRDNSDIALGNVIGSNIANIGLVLGATALIAPVKVEGGLLRREVPILILATALLPGILWDHGIGRREAALLLVGAVGFTWIVLRTGLHDPETRRRLEEESELPEDAADRSRPTLVAFTVGGAAALTLGGHLLVEGASSLAMDLGVSQRIVGLTIVAIGTSLPELAASLVAAIRGHASMAVGNIVGSNIFNLLWVLGGAGLIHPISGSLEELLGDLLAMLLITLLLSFMLRKERTISRFEGVLLAVCYLAFLGWLGLS